jgi:hypothetical protein
MEEAKSRRVAVTMAKKQPLGRMIRWELIISLNMWID